MKKTGLVFILALAATFTSCKHDADYYSDAYPPTEQQWVQALSQAYPQWEAPAYVPAHGGAKNTQPAPAVQFLDSPVQEAPAAEAVVTPVVETPVTPPSEASLDAQPAESEALIID